MTNQCVICFEGEIDFKCSFCHDGGFCMDCVSHISPQGFAYSGDDSETKCPCCRQKNFKWIYDEMLSMMVEDIAYNDFYNEKCFKIFEKNHYGDEWEDEKARRLEEDDCESDVEIVADTTV